MTIQQNNRAAILALLESKRGEPFTTGEIMKALGIGMSACRSDAGWLVNAGAIRHVRSYGDAARGYSYFIPTAEQVAADRTRIPVIAPALRPRPQHLEAVERARAERSAYPSKT